ncbi:MAG: hypothetical protein ABJ308_01650 [Halieaceae bacterium]
MHYLRSVLSVLSAPVLYGVLCVPLLGVLYAQFPELVNKQGGTSHVGLLIFTELFQLFIITVCGYVAARIAPWHLRHHVVIATVLMLLIGVSVQLSFWESVPVWHHYVFFACIVAGMHLGGHIRNKQLGGLNSVGAASAEP